MSPVLDASNTLINTGAMASLLIVPSSFSHTTDLTSPFKLSTPYVYAFIRFNIKSLGVESPYVLPDVGVLPDVSDIIPSSFTSILPFLDPDILKTLSVPSADIRLNAGSFTNKLLARYLSVFNCSIVLPSPPTSFSCCIFLRWKVGSW